MFLLGQKYLGKSRFHVVKSTDFCKNPRKSASLPCPFKVTGGPIQICGLWMRYSRVVVERLTANAVVATVLGSIPASSDTRESEGRQMKHC
jgi:hypothetical protein